MPDRVRNAVVLVIIQYPIASKETLPYRCAALPRFCRLRSRASAVAIYRRMFIFTSLSQKRATSCTLYHKAAPALK
jgi:hypothetical protein